MDDGRMAGWTEAPAEDVGDALVAGFAASGVDHLFFTSGSEIGFFQEATAKARAVLGRSVAFAASAVGAATGADAIVLATEWNEFRELDWTAVREAMRGDVLVDGRNLYDPVRMHELGFRYFGMGRHATAAESQAAHLIAE